MRVKYERGNIHFVVFSGTWNAHDLELNVHRVQTGLKKLSMDIVLYVILNCIGS